VDPETQVTVDEVLLTLMRAPRTYTREDTVEINCHGGPVPLRKVLDLTLHAGAQLAEPGEFTRRAFRNGRIDLAQAESVLDVIEASTEDSLVLALEGLKGGLSKRIEHLGGALVDLLGTLEATIEFPEEELGVPAGPEVLKTVSLLISEISCLLAMGERTRPYRDGVRVTIVGKPNVGKSTLFNRILDRDRAIVSSTPGTTRDTLEEHINLKGVPIVLTDTAGLGTSRDRLAGEAVLRARRAMEQADFLLVVVDGSRELSGEDYRLLRRARRYPGLLVMNKADLPQVLDTERLGPAGPVEDTMAVSASTGCNLEKLLELMTHSILNRVSRACPGEVLLNLRQSTCLKRARDSLRRAEEAASAGVPEELMATEVKSALAELGGITGATTSEDVLESVFSRFCIGK